MSLAQARALPDDAMKTLAEGIFPSIAALAESIAKAGGIFTKREEPL